MQNLKNLFWFCLAFICNPVFAIQQTDTLAIDVYYRQGGYKTMEKGIDDQRSLDHFVAEVNSLTQDPYTAIEDLTIVSYASPEGNSLENKELSRMRTSSLGTYLKEQLPVGVREKISEEAAGVLAVGASFFAEAGGVAGVAEREIFFVDDFVHVIAGERHLGGSDHGKIFAFDVVFVALFAAARIEAAAFENFAGDHVGDGHELEAMGEDFLEAELE